MAVEVFRLVLTLTIHVIRRLRQDSGACLSRSLAMPAQVIDAYLHHHGMVGYNVALGDGKAALTCAHFNSVIGHAAAQ